MFDLWTSSDQTRWSLDHGIIGTTLLYFHLTNQNGKKKLLIIGILLNRPDFNFLSKICQCLDRAKKDNYFDNKIILRKFKRLLLLIKDKE